MLQWHLKLFNELTNLELYQIVRLRIDVFVVEQDCPFNELDGKDTLLNVQHFFATKNNEVVSYLRILPPDISYPNMPSLGRILTGASIRGTGIGNLMLEKALTLTDKQWPNKICRISAQSHLQKFYNNHGFCAVGEQYLEDDIPHIGMERPPN